MLAQPAISASHVAFIYDADLWVAGREGSGAVPGPQPAATEVDGDGRVPRGAAPGRMRQTCVRPPSAINSEPTT